MTWITNENKKATIYIVNFRPNHYLCITMGNFMKQQEARKEVRERERTSRETLGKYFYDLSKLSFTGLVIGWVMPLSGTDKSYIDFVILVSGILLTVLFAVIARKILR